MTWVGIESFARIFYRPRQHLLLQVLALTTLLLFLVTTLSYLPSTNIRIKGFAYPSPSRTSFPPPCHTVQAPANLRSNDSLVHQWKGLQILFTTHTPLMLSPQASSGGQASDLQDDELPMPLPTSAAEAIPLKSTHRQLVESVPPYPRDQYRGRGIVMLAGGSKSEFAATSLGMLRQLGSKLPVELWFLHITPKERVWCQQLAGQGITCQVLEDLYADADEAFLYEEQTETATMILSSFDQIIYLSSDTIPVVKPDDIFDAQAFQKSGVVLWPDFWASSETRWAAFITGMQADARVQRLGDGTIDAAQMVWHKKRHWKTLVLAAYYSHHALFYHRLFSQKLSRPGRLGFGASFATALRSLHASFHVVPHYLSPVFLNPGIANITEGGVSVLQAYPASPDIFRPVFLHTSILQFGIRDLMCDNSCVENFSATSARPRENQRIIGKKVRTLGAVASRIHPVHGQIRDRKRLLASKNIKDRGLDFEPKVWMVLERLACGKGGVWSGEALCRNTRAYVTEAFGQIEYRAPDC